MLPIFGLRRHRERIDSDESAGGNFWSEVPDPQARYKLWYAVDELGNGSAAFFSQVRKIVVESLGLPSLQSGSNNERYEIQAGLLSGSVDVVFSLVEACLVVGTVLSEPNATYRSESARGFHSRLRRFHERIDMVLVDHRLAFARSGSRLVPKSSETLHAGVVEPTLRLLGERDGWSGVEKSYIDALGELHGGKPEDAITDAATALQEALGVLGLEGNTVSKRMRRAVERGVLGPQDSPLVAAMAKLGDWVEADRATSGDAHNSNAASPEDAWLVVHVVGAIILRLAAGIPRGTDARQG